MDGNGCFTLLLLHTSGTGALELGGIGVDERREVGITESGPNLCGTNGPFGATRNLFTKDVTGGGARRGVKAHIVRLKIMTALLLE